MVGTIDTVDSPQGGLDSTEGAPTSENLMDREDSTLEEPIIGHRSAEPALRCKCLDRRAPGAPEFSCPLGHTPSVLAISVSRETATPVRIMTRSQARAVQDPTRPPTQVAPVPLATLKPHALPKACSNS